MNWIMKREKSYRETVTEIMQLLNRLSDDGRWKRRIVSLRLR